MIEGISDRSLGFRVWTWHMIEEIRDRNQGPVLSLAIHPVNEKRPAPNDPEGPPAKLGFRV
jgi:hypothetical protein